MALEYISLNENDTKELRKELGLPITKGLRYMRKENSAWKEYGIVDYRIVETYQPSGAHSLLITLENGKQVRILADYLVDMQKSTFVSELEGKTIENNKEVEEEAVISQKANKEGIRIDATPETYIVVDLETSGTNHYTDEIIEIGAIKYVNGIEKERYSTLIKQEKPISSKIIKLTGITNEMLEAEGEEKKKALEAFYLFLGNDIVIGHNIASFDSKFIEDAFWKVLGCHFSNDYVDTLFLARKELPNLEHHRLEDLAYEYSIDYSCAHRAIEDCSINHLVYELLAFGRLSNSNESCDRFLANRNSGNQTNDTEDLVMVNDSELDGWKEKVKNALNIFVLEKGLPEKSVFLAPNISRLTNTVTSYSICIYEPDLVEENRTLERNSIVARIIEGKLKSEPDVLTIEPKVKSEFEFLQIPDDAIKYEPEKATPYIRMNQYSGNLISFLLSCVELALDNYIPLAASFACCSQYEACSDAKRCIHVNQLYSRACQYRKNLENGKIFYGKKNV